MRVQELAALYQSGNPLPLLVDVRTQEERDLALLEPSILIPLHELPFRLEELLPFRDKPVVVYCHHGVRSAHAVQWLEQMGFEQVVNLEGGIDSWSIEVDPEIQRY